MSVPRKIIFYELNEVPRRIFEEFVRWRPGSAVARRSPELRWYDTYAEDESVLSPWITWSTVHRGVIDQQHKIQDFGQEQGEVNREYPQLWEVLASKGVRVGVCGSLHSYPPPRDFTHYAFYLPDTFAAGCECFPKRLEDFQHFNLRMARESARNVSTRMPWSSALRLLASAPQLGLRPTTAVDVGRQLVSERVKPSRKVRRRTYQTVLAFDIFMRQLDETRPDFCTFFTTHVASAMHRYWAAAFPTDYQSFEYDDDWVRTYRQEIDFTMGKFDEELARLLAFVDANDEYQLWITTSMGQAATEARPLETQLYITDRAKFMAALGMAREDWSEQPAMLPRYSFRLESEQMASFAERLKRLTINGQPIDHAVADGNFVRLKLGQENLYESGECITVDGRPLMMSEIGLENVRIDDRSGTTAYHIPQGCLAIYDPRDRKQKQKQKLQPEAEISTVEIAPAVLRNFGISPPTYMVPGSALGGA